MVPERSHQECATGSLAQHEMYKPSLTDGALIYFSCKDITNELDRIEGAGGEIMQPKTKIGEGYGFIAFMKDSEGDRLALHSNR